MIRGGVVEVNVFGSKKRVMVSAVGGAALLAGGLFAGSALVSAQEPSPTPGAEQQDQQNPRSDGTTPKSREECEKDGSGGSDSSQSGSSTGGGVRSRGVDNSRYF